MSGGRIWTPEEEAALRENWGMQGGIPAVARKMGRSQLAIKEKAGQMRLGSYVAAGERLSWNELYRVINGSLAGSSYTRQRWERMGFPFRQVRVQGSRVRSVTLDDFWAWAEAHPNEIDFNRFEEGALGREPEWVRERRRVAFENARCAGHVKRRWTPEEDARLIQMVRSGRCWEEITREFDRSMDAIRRRCYDLYLKPRKGAQRRWAPEEIAQLKELHRAGFNKDAIARRLKRSPQSVRGMLGRTEE